MIEDVYLGDGVYASFDGWHIILDLRAQDATTRIALEPSVLQNLDLYRAQINQMVGPQANHAVGHSEDNVHCDGDEDDEKDPTGGFTP